MNVPVNFSAIGVQNPVAELLLLRAINRLVVATDTNDLEVASQDLLDDLIPGSTVRRVSATAAQRYPESASVHVVRVMLRDGAMLVLTSPRSMGCLAPLRMAAQVIEARARSIEQHDELSRSIELLSRSEQLQHALFAIANLASDTNADLASMFSGLHAIVGELTYAKNFFIALFDAVHDSITYPYYADEADAQPPAPATPTRMSDIAHSPTWFVIHESRALWGARPELQAMIGPDFTSTGPQCTAWLGVPLLADGRAIGCVVVQSYDTAHIYQERDRDLLVFLAQHIRSALEPRLAGARRAHTAAHPRNGNPHDGVANVAAHTPPMKRVSRAREHD